MGVCIPRLCCFTPLVTKEYYTRMCLTQSKAQSTLDRPYARRLSDILQHVHVDLDWINVESESDCMTCKRSRKTRYASCDELTKKDVKIYVIRKSDVSFLDVHLQTKLSYVTFDINDGIRIFEFSSGVQCRRISRKWQTLSIIKKIKSYFPGI
ncbi:hypothetical protein OS493_036776 [Desmophyllum pertusum]|uniref:Uncharacterized protein n=1 Tax=Desmophyllum pertusum TaxID=174260 RepID=A0A9W9YLC8_9CNID|nr:hypothetical protein OS493_036776 [Desmophyllum pertusum]